MGEESKIKLEKKNQEYEEIEVKKEELTFVKDLESMGITMISDPLNVLQEEGQIKYEGSEQEEEEEDDDGLHSFTGHSLDARSKRDAFESTTILNIRICI